MLRTFLVDVLPLVALAAATYAAGYDAGQRVALRRFAERIDAVERWAYREER